MAKERKSSRRKTASSSKRRTLQVSRLVIQQDVNISPHCEQGRRVPEVPYIWIKRYQQEPYLEKINSARIDNELSSRMFPPARLPSPPSSSSSGRPMSLRRHKEEELAEAVSPLDDRNVKITFPKYLEEILAFAEQESLKYVHQESLLSDTSTSPPSSPPKRRSARLASSPEMEQTPSATSGQQKWKMVRVLCVDMATQTSEDSLGGKILYARTGKGSSSSPSSDSDLGKRRTESSDEDEVPRRRRRRRESPPEERQIESRPSTSRQADEEEKQFQAHMWSRLSSSSDSDWEKRTESSDDDEV